MPLDLNIPTTTDELREILDDDEARPAGFSGRTMPMEMLLRLREIERVVSDDASILIARDWEGCVFGIIDADETPLDSVYLVEDGRIAQGGTNVPRYFPNVPTLLDSLPRRCERCGIETFTSDERGECLNCGLLARPSVPDGAHPLDDDEVAIVIEWDGGFSTRIENLDLTPDLDHAHEYARSIGLDPREYRIVENVAEEGRTFYVGDPSIPTNAPREVVLAQGRTLANFADNDDVVSVRCDYSPDAIYSDEDEEQGTFTIAYKYRTTEQARENLPSLEVTIYNLDGSVRDSADFG